MLKANQPPPQNYYADNVARVFSYVLEHHKALLSADESNALNKIVSLTPTSLRLLARLLTRKGPWFRISALNYVEVGSTAAAVSVLEDNDLCVMNSEIPADCLLNLLRKAELTNLFPHHCEQGRSRIHKSELIVQLVASYSDRQIRNRVVKSIKWLNLTITPLVMLCKLLYFGNRHHDWSTFILEDLGVTQCETYPLRTGSVFASREEIETYLLIKQIASLKPNPADVSLILSCLREKHTNRWLERARNKTLNSLGRSQERLGSYETALQFYEVAQTTPARERQTRIFHKHFSAQCVEDKLQEIRDHPWDIQERLFAERFPGNHPPVAAPVTHYSLSQAERPSQIEEFALEQLEGPEGQGWHTENALPMGLFGLAFWDVIFADIKGAFLHPFQSHPLDLYWPDFVAERIQLIDRQIEKLKHNFSEQIMATFKTKVNVTNSLVNWRLFDETFICQLLTNIPAQALLTLTQLVLEDIRQSRSGFPDLLMVYAKGNFEFVEVKGPTDQLQPNQRVWLQRLAAAQLPARVFKIHDAG